jgi:hypothetical protein
MLVQLNRSDSFRTATPTATELPLTTFTQGPPSPVVAVFGHPSRVAGLESHLPAGWSIRPVAAFEDVLPGELVLITQAKVEQVDAGRAVLPRRARIVAVVDEDARAELVAAVLTAGADVCVRGTQPAILASHLVACRRRQLTDRWATLEAALPQL